MKKILIIEDSQIISELIEFQLNIHGDYDIEIVNNIEKMSDKDIEEADIILLDHFLGRKDNVMITGFDFVDKITTNSELIIISGQKDVNIAIQYIEKGALAYFNKDKPNFLDELTKIVHTITANHDPITRKQIQHDVLNNINQSFS